MTADNTAINGGAMYTAGIAACQTYVINQIGGKLNREETTHITNAVERWMNTAQEVCNRNDMPPAMVHIVADIVVAAYNIRGSEGMSSESAGVQSAAFDDLYDKLSKNLIRTGLRLIKI